MLNKKNLVILEGGLTRDPEEFETPNVIHLSIGVDNAGSEKGVQYPSGYFDLKIWMNDSKHTPPALSEYVRNALKEGTLKKGSRISVIGSLKHERWETAGKKSSKVIINVEAIEIYTAKTAAPAKAYAATTEDEPNFVPNF